MTEETRKGEGCPHSDTMSIAEYIRDVFENAGEFFDPDPHLEDNLLIIFKNPPRDLASCLERLGIDALDTTDESGSTKYVVVYDKASVKLFLKLVKPPIPDVEPLAKKIKAYDS